MKGVPGISRWLFLLPVVAVSLAIAASASAKSPSKLYAKVGPGFTISLKDGAGRVVKRIKAGRYVIVVTDRTGDDAHNFHLKGAGLDLRTGVGFVGTRTWTVRLVKGKTYRYICDPHELAMHGSFKAV